MDLSQLHCFVRVAESGGVGRAAITLSLSQSTLSRKIRQLEVELRKNLLIRDGRSVKLTEEGVLFLTYAKAFIELADKAREEITRYDSSPTGKVVVGATDAVDSAVITHLATKFRERFPKATLDILTGRDWSIYESLCSRRIDVGIMCDPRPSPTLEIKPLEQLELFLISPAAKKKKDALSSVQFSKLASYSLILPSRPNTIRGLMEAAARSAGIKLKVALQVSGGHFILDLVRHGQGHAVQSRIALERCPFANELDIIPIVNPTIVRTLTVSVHSQRRATYLTNETVKIISDCFKTKPAKLMKPVTFLNQAYKRSPAVEEFEY